MFTAINKKLRKLLILQYLIRHTEVLKDINFINAYRLMKNGSKSYINDISLK